MHGLRKILLILYLIFSVSLTSSIAQTDEKVAQPETENKTTETTSGSETDSAGIPDISESFRPSEEISEDLPVSFPVDI